MRILSVILLLVIGTHAKAQERRPLFDSLDYKVEMQASLSSGDHNPLWLNANRYGLSSLKTANGYVRGAVVRPLAADSTRRWGVGYGADGAIAAGFTSKLVVQQLYGEVRWLRGVLTVGSKEQPMELKNQELSSGSQTLGINARPIPQVRLALPDYWTIPGTKGWLAIKGHIAYGMQTDDHWQKDFTHQQSRYTEHTRYHSKAGYLKIGPRRVSLELGLEMACQFGGDAWRMKDGEMVKTVSSSGVKSMINAFFPGGAEVTDGDFINKEGNHLGSWVARFNLDRDRWALGLYADHFFEDNSSMLHINKNGWGTGDDWHVQKESRYFVYDFKDWMLGAELRLKEQPWLNTIVIEYLYTKYQGGPVYHDHSPNVSEHIVGRDNFYNHYLFPGWQHWGQVIGNPLYLSPLYNDDGAIEVRNNRFVAWHLGLSGSPMVRLHYRVLATWQRGYGTYYYLYPDPAHNVSLLGEATYRGQKGWSFTAALGLDSGKIYGNNFGLQLTATKTGLLKLKRK